MSWQEKVVCRILCIIARIIGHKDLTGTTLQDIKNLANTIEYGQPKETSNV